MPNSRAPSYVKQTLTELRGELNRNTIMVGDFVALLQTLDRSSRQRINKETTALNNTLDQMHLTDIYRTFHPATIEYKCARNIFQDRPYVRTQTSLRKSEKIEILPYIFSDHNGMKLKISNKRKTAKFTNIWKLNSTVLNI